jgi:hypothetical protein
VRRLQSGNAALKIVDFRPTLSPRDGRIGDGGVGSVPISRAANLEHIFESVEIDGAAPIPQIGRHAVPSHGSGVVGLYTLAELIHPTKLIFRVAAIREIGAKSFWKCSRGDDKNRHERKSCQANVDEGVVPNNTRQLRNMFTPFPNPLPWHAHRHSTTRLGCVAGERAAQLWR